MIIDRQNYPQTGAVKSSQAAGHHWQPKPKKKKGNKKKKFPTLHALRVTRGTSSKLSLPFLYRNLQIPQPQNSKKLTDKDIHPCI